MIVLKVILLLSLSVSFALLIPMTANALLQRKHRSYHKWWHNCYQDYLGLNGKQKSLPKYLQAWLQDTKRLARKQALSKEQVELLQEAGVEGYDKKHEHLSTEELKRGYRYQAKWWHLVLFALFAACLDITSAYVVAIPLARTLFLVIAFLLVLSAICDTKQRIIPWEITLSLLLCGLVWQWAISGVRSLIIAVLLAGGICFLLHLLGVAFAKAGKQDAIGRGDLRMIFAGIVACGPQGSLLGAGIAVTLIVTYLAVFYLRKQHLPKTIALAPYLGVWFLSGLIFSLI